MSAVRRGDMLREAVADGIERVVGALEGRGDAVATEGNAGLMVSSGCVPDLASRLRRDLQTEGVVISGWARPRRDGVPS